MIQVKLDEKTLDTVVKAENVSLRKEIAKLQKLNIKLAQENHQLKQELGNLQWQKDCLDEVKKHASCLVDLLERTSLVSIQHGL